MGSIKISFRNDVIKANQFFAICLKFAGAMAKIRVTFVFSLHFACNVVYLYVILKLVRIKSKSRRYKRMKLKLVVASMSVLGLISCPVLADTQTKHKHHHHKKVHHHHHHANYKEMGELPVQPAPVVQAAPMVDMYSLTLDSMNQNLNRSVHATPDWFQHIAITGGANFDATWGNRSMGFMGENARRLALNDVYLNATAMVNDWAKAFASLSFNNAYPGNNAGGTLINGIDAPVNADYPGIYSAAYTNNRLNLEQGYMTFGSFNCSPFFVQLGKQFQDFGRYTIHPLTRTLTQVLSESLQTSAKIGFITNMGLHGAIYAFDNSLTRSGLGHTQTVYGAALGFDQPSDQLGFDLGVGYMSNMTGVNDVAYAISAFETIGNSPNTAGTYNGTVGAMNGYADINAGPFSLGGRYTTSLQKFNPNTLSTQYLNVVGSGARPWAADVTAAYAFNLFAKNQNVYVGYQASNNAVNLFIPRTRWLVGYGIDTCKNTSLGVEVHHNNPYSSGNGVNNGANLNFSGNSQSSNEVHARASVKFG